MLLRSSLSIAAIEPKAIITSLGPNESLQAGKTYTIKGLALGWRTAREGGGTQHRWWEDLAAGRASVHHRADLVALVD